MITRRPDVDPKGLYGIGEAAKALGISRSSVKRYLEAGALKFHVRKLNNRRVISGSQILRCWEATYLGIIN